MESALLVMSALGKGIDLSVWLMEGEEVPVEDFNDKFTQLALTLGVGEDWETKQELDLAVATKSLKQIEALFGKPSRKGVKCVDVTMFLNCSKQKVSAYLANMEDGADEVGGVGWPALAVRRRPPPSEVRHPPMLRAVAARLPMRAHRAGGVSSAQPPRARVLCAVGSGACVRAPASRRPLCGSASPSP